MTIPWRSCLAPLAALAVCLCACSKEPAIGPPDQVYTLRGRVESVPTPDKPASELMIRHEPLPGFVGKDGKVVGMDSMAMPFTPARGVSLEGVKPGDIVEFTFEVRWKSRPFSRLTVLKKLSPETRLDLGKSG